MKLLRYVATVVVMLIATPVLACTCSFGTPEGGFYVAQAVFTGKVIRSGKSTWTVAVDRVWKGDVESRVELFDAHAGSSCATGGIKKGRSYLFLVDVENKNGKIRYSPQVCNWTTALKTTKITIEPGRMTLGAGVDARWVEEWVLMGQGEGKPPITAPGTAQRYTGSDGRVRVALSKQPFSPTGTSSGPNTMANGGIQQLLEAMGASVRIEEASLTANEATEYGAWKRLGMALGHFAEIVEQNERDGYFTVGLLATCPSMPGLVAGLQHSGPGGKPIKIGMLWLDAHPDFNTPETTRSGSLGGMPVAVATGRALQRMRLDAHLDPPLQDQHVVMAGVRLTDPLEQQLLDQSSIQQLSVDDLRNMTPAVFAQLDRLSRLTDKIYVHIDMDVLDPREVMGHGNKVPNGPSSEQLAKLFEAIFSRYPKASAIGFATIPSVDEGGLSLAAVNRMIAGAVRGVKMREQQSGSAKSLTNSAASEWSVGDASSPVVLEVFNDYECPPCGFFNVELKRIQVKYAGRVRVVYRNYPLTTHVNAMLAAQVAEAAGLQGKFFEMIDLLYLKRVSWAGSKNADKLFLSYARELKLDLKKFRADLMSEEVRQRIARDVERARSLKVDGTPTVVINGELISHERLQKLDSELEAKLNAAKSASP